MASGDEITIKISAQNAQFLAAMKGIKSSLEGATSSGRSNFKSFAADAGSAFDSVASGIGSMLKVAGGIALSGSFGLVAATKAAWNQVDAVQQAKAGLDRYYSSASDVNGIMASLVKYAQSDAGVLFNRKDLFNSAQGLAMYNIEASKVTGYVQIMSRGMASNRITWDDMDRVIGRVIATSKLGGEEFEMLRKAGYNLDSSLRNASMGADELFKHLDNSIAKDVSQDLSNITPIGIRLDSALRGVGNSFLGVNDMGDKFVKGGVGYGINQLFLEMTNFLKTPEMKEGIAKIGTQFAGFMADATPVIKNILMWMVGNMDTVVSGVKGLATAFVLAKVAAIGFNIAAKANPMTTIVTAIIAVVGALVFLQDRFNIFGKTWEWIKTVSAGVWSAITTGISAASESVTSLYNGALKWLSDRVQDIGRFFKETGDNAVSAFSTVKALTIDTFNALKNTAGEVFSSIKSWVEENKTAIINWSIVIGTLMIPMFLKIGIAASVAAGKAIASFAVAGGSAVKNAAIASSAWVRSSAITVGSFVASAASSVKNGVVAGAVWVRQAALSSYAWVTKTLPAMIATFGTMAGDAVVKSAVAGGAWVMQAARTTGAWFVAMGSYMAQLGVAVAQTVMAGVRMAGAWLMAMGPIGILVAVVAGAVALIIANWDSVSAFVGKVFTGIGNIAVSAWNGIVAYYSTVGGFFFSIFQGAYNNITGIFGGIGNFFRGVWGTITGIFGNVGTAIGNAIGGSVKGVVNSILGFAENTINGFIRAINSAIGAINKIPGVSIGQLGLLNIPKLATGGIVPATPGGRQVIVAEGGQAEWVVPEKKMASLVSQVMNRTQGDGTPVRGGGTTINQENHFTVNNNIDMQQAASQIGYMVSQR